MDIVVTHMISSGCVHPRSSDILTMIFVVREHVDGGLPEQCAARSISVRVLAVARIRMTRNSIFTGDRERSPAAYIADRALHRDRAGDRPTPERRDPPTPQSTPGESNLIVFWQNEAVRAQTQLNCAQSVIRSLHDLCRVHAPTQLTPLESVIRDALAGPPRLEAERRVLHLDGGIISFPEIVDAPPPRRLIMTVHADEYLTPTVLDSSESEDPPLEAAAAGGA